MARTDPQLNFRIPAELKERLEAAALENKRTLTAELVARLEESLDQPNERAASQQKQIEAFVQGIVQGLKEHGIRPGESDKRKG